jgi:hypothetical protein
MSGYLLICYIYTIGTPQPSILNQVLANKEDVEKTITALKSMEENTDCITVRIKI